MKYFHAGVLARSITARLFAGAISGAALLVVAPPVPAPGQSVQLLRTFAPGGFKDIITFTNADGVQPTGGLVQSGGKLYGVANSGGSAGAGTVFAVNTDGSGFTNLHNFTALDQSTQTNTDGASPSAGLLLAGGKLYGTAYDGGTNGDGVLFSLNTNGTGFTNLYNFTAVNNNNGANPSAALVLAGANLYGTTYNGGSQGSGVVFSFKTNGTGGISVLHTFSAADPNTGANSDGANPSAQLLFSGTKLYGTTASGGTNGQGVVFAINTNTSGSGFSVLHHFDDVGANPTAALVLSGGTLYGLGGSNLFALNTNGTGFTNLHQFSTSVGAAPATPGLSLSSGTLYGAASSAGTLGGGMMFSVSTNGSNFDDLCDFADASNLSFPPTNSGGAFPNGGPILLNGQLYGTTSQGGTSGCGVLFAVVTNNPPVLSAQLSGTSFLLSFQTVSGFNYTVQQKTNLSDINWMNYTSFIGNGSLTQFTRPAANPAQLFFRVSQP
jgi:uncharacterized repeat protein (TIGR03803 family)